MPRDSGSDAVERARIGFHYIVAARAMNVQIHKARHDGHSRRYVVFGTRGNGDFVAMANADDSRSLNDDHAVVDLILRGEDAAGIHGNRRHSKIILLELPRGITPEPCILFLLRYNRVALFWRRWNGK